MKNFFLSKIEKTLNNIYRTKLSIKLNLELSHYSNEDETYFIARFNNSDQIVGISRIVFNFQKYVDKQNKFFKQNIDPKNNNVFLTGIWVEDEFRNQGIGKSLLNKRLSLLVKGDFIFTDMRKDSYLKKYYLEIGMSILGEDNKHIFFGGKYNGKKII